MILHRISSALRREYWFQVIIEIIIVVIGIFLGLQVSEWNEGRLDRVEEQKYLERFVVELEESITRNYVFLNTMDRFEGYTDLMIKSLSECKLAPEDRDMFATGIYSLGKT